MRVFVSLGGVPSSDVNSKRSSAFSVFFERSWSSGILPSVASADELSGSLVSMGKANAASDGMFSSGLNCANI